MFRKVIVVLLFVFPIILSAQLSESDKIVISEILTERVNKLRVKLGKTKVKRHLDLTKAAQLHSDYMSKKNRLNHTELGTDFPQPKDRILHYNNSFVSFGENILLSTIVTFPTNKARLEKLANSIFRGWYKSPGHYANMISDEFYYSDYGFTYNPKSKRIYATQLFAKKGYIIPGQLSDNSFYIESSSQDCTALTGQYSNIVVNIGNSVYVENNEVFLAYHNIEMVKKILKNQKDGFAIDLVTRDQLICNQENKLDVSTVYDGVLLKPLYRDQILSNNRAENPKRLIISLGKIPKHLIGKSLSPNIIVLKNGLKCSYAVPSPVPSKKYDLREIEPEIYIPNVPLKVTGINGIYKVNFDFESGKVIPQSNPDINISKENIHSIDIKSFTSVDGLESENKKLHTKRANFIQDYISSTLALTKTPITVEAKENWELCFYQLELFGLENTLETNKLKIKNYIQSNKTNIWKRALDLQRKSKAIIYLKGIWKKEDIHYLNYNLSNALLTKNYDLANQVLAEMYLKEEGDLFLNEEFIKDKLFNEKELVQNTAALLLKNINYYDLDNVVFFVRNWLSKPENISEKAQKNLLNLYTITSRHLLQHWDNSVEDFSKVMHPEKVEPLFKNYKSQNKVNPLFLNFHMSSIDYYGQINYSTKIDISFNFITDYFKVASKSVKDDIDLSLFFNSWSMYQMTVDKLVDRFADNTLDEASAFILAKTFVASSASKNKEALKAIHKRAIFFNKEKWCLWIDKSFQNLRNEGVKNLYCKTCN